jgi:hypothetical protein
LIRPRDDLHIHLDFGVNFFELGDGIFPGSDIGVAGRKLPKDDMRFSECAIGAGGEGESGASKNLRKPGSKIAGEMKLMANLISRRGSLVMATVVDYSRYLLPRGISFPFASVTPASVEGRHHSCLFPGFIKRFH